MKFESMTFLKKLQSSVPENEKREKEERKKELSFTSSRSKQCNYINTQMVDIYREQH